MKLSSLVLSALVSISIIASAADDFPLVPAVECTPRAGLPNFFARLKAGKEVKIGYLGGSITAQEGWRPKTLKHFQSSFPEAKVTHINAAIGGTGSDLGVFRLKQDVLDQKPDFLFVEFAVNDGGADPKQIFRCMEGIVRQTWKALPECDICFVYTITEALVGPMLEGKFQRSASAMEKVADHYGIPTIHMGMEVAKLAKAGKLVWKGKLPKTDDEKKATADSFIFAPDSVHPHPETGHELYLAAVQRSMKQIEALNGKAGAHELKTPFVSDNYEHAKMLPITEATLSSGFAKADSDIGKRFANRLSQMQRANKAGESVTFKFKGTRASIYDIVGPDCGQVKVTIDNQPARVVPRFDSYCTYHRLSMLQIGTELSDAVHTVRIEILPDQPDKAKILSQRNEKIDNPKRFDDTAFYPGAILLVGELIK